MEETGFTALSVHPLGRFAPCSGRLSNWLHSFYVTIRPAAEQKNVEPGIELKLVTLPQLAKMIRTGDSTLQVHAGALLLAGLRGFISLELSSGNAHSLLRQGRARNRHRGGCGADAGSLNSHHASGHPCVFRWNPFLLWISAGWTQELGSSVILLQPSGCCVWLCYPNFRSVWVAAVRCELLIVSQSTRQNNICALLYRPTLRK